VIMPWKEHGLMEERFRLVEEWNSGDWSLAELCRFYEVSRGTGYKWVARYEAGGLEGCAIYRALRTSIPTRWGRRWKIW